MRKPPSRRELESHEVSTIKNALRTAAEAFDGHAAEFGKVATLLRGGGEYPMFAPGESGARAADRFVEQFQMQAKDSRKLMDELEIYDQVTISLASEE